LSATAASTCAGVALVPARISWRRSLLTKSMLSRSTCATSCGDRATCSASAVVMFAPRERVRICAREGRDVVRYNAFVVAPGVTVGFRKQAVDPRPGRNGSRADSLPDITDIQIHNRPRHFARSYHGTSCSRLPSPSAGNVTYRGHQRNSPTGATMCARRSGARQSSTTYARATRPRPRA
jgi:hypothetical protein